MATESAGYAPVDLPDDLVVWDVGWATAGGGAGKIGRLFDRVLDSITDRI